MEVELRILTLNCWGIPVFSKDRKPRMKAIAEELATNRYDIICLQEVWSVSDYNLIRTKVKKVLPHSQYFYSGVFGSGICIISKYPMQEVFFHQWPVNGYVHKLQHGDWFGGKGVGLCRLRINDFDINIYSAHLHAEYDRHCDEYLTHRVLQAFDIAQFIRLTGRKADLVILAGDLNTEPGDLAYRLITDATGLVDSYIETGIKDCKYFSTNEGHTNSYTSPDLVKQKFTGKRIDYIMYRNSVGVKVSLTSYEHPLPSRVPGCEFSYSDHEAVSATLQLCHGEQIAQSDNNDLSYKTVLLESMQVCDEALSRLNYHKRVYWFLTSFLIFMLFVSIGMDAPFNFTKTFHIIRFLITAFLCFTLVMATLWNNIEYNAVLAGKTSMEINLRQLLDLENSKTM